MLQGGSVSLLGPAKIGKSSLLLALSRSWQGHIIGPLDCLALEDRDDFYDLLAEKLSLPGAGWRSHIRPALQQTALLLLLDELDKAPQLGLTSEDWGRWRAMCEANRGLKLLTASRRPLKEIFPDSGRSSPGYNIFAPFTLEPLPPAEAGQLLAHPWAASAATFDPPTHAQLLELCAGHPFKLQRAAYHRYEALTDPAYPWRQNYEQDLALML